MEKMLDGKVCLITGAGRGIGMEAALMFGAEGGKVVVSDLDREPAEEVAAQIRAQGGQAVAYVGDVTANGFAEGFIQTALDEFKGVDVIVNNAGFIWDSLIHRMTDEQWEKILAVHCTAPFKILRAAAPFIRATAKKEIEAGRQVMRKVVNISSTAGVNGNAGQANYSTAKSGILGLTKTMSKEWGRYNVCVNAVAFAWIETRLTAEKDESSSVAIGDITVPAGIPQASREALKKAIPLGRPGTANEAARGILFMASPLADYVSGQVLVVSGGR